MLITQPVDEPEDHVLHKAKLTDPYHSRYGLRDELTLTKTYEQDESMATSDLLKDMSTTLETTSFPASSAFLTRGPQQRSNSMGTLPLALQHHDSSLKREDDLNDAFPPSSFESGYSTSDVSTTVHNVQENASQKNERY